MISASNGRVLWRIGGACVLTKTHQLKTRGAYSRRKRRRCNNVTSYPQKIRGNSHTVWYSPLNQCYQSIYDQPRRLCSFVVNLMEIMLCNVWCSLALYKCEILDLICVCPSTRANTTGSTEGAVHHKGIWKKSGNQIRITLRFDFIKILRNGHFPRTIACNGASVSPCHHHPCFKGRKLAELFTGIILFKIIHALFGSIKCITRSILLFLF